MPLVQHAGVVRGAGDAHADVGAALLAGKPEEGLLVVLRRNLLAGQFFAAPRRHQEERVEDRRTQPHDPVTSRYVASLFEAVVYQNLATLTRGNTPLPEILLLGGPNLFFKGLQEAWRHHLGKVWKERKVQVSDDRDMSSLIRVPDNALYYAALGCVEVALRENGATGLYNGAHKLK